MIRLGALHSRYAVGYDAGRLSSSTLIFMTLACNESELEQLLGDVAFTRDLGFVLHSIADGQCTIYVPFRATFERPGGIVIGQVFMAAADVAMWLAIKTRLGIATIQ